MLLQLYIEFYQISCLKAHEMKTKYDVSQLVNKFQHFIEVADHLNLKQAIRWGKSDLQRIMTVKAHLE